MYVWGLPPPLTLGKIPNDPSFHHETLRGIVNVFRVPGLTVAFHSFIF